jgi:hypothetical protein
MGMAFHKVEAPDVIGPFRPQTDAGAVVEPQQVPWILTETGTLKSDDIRGIFENLTASPF